jgi:hypothetical protein
MELNINENLKHPIFDSQFGKVEQIQTDRGPVTVCFMSNLDSVSNLTLEFEKKTLFHIIVVWILTAYSFISNITIALWIKMISEPKKSRKEILWKLGRNPYHYSSFFYDRFSPINHDVKVFAASWQALEMFYNFYLRPYTLNLQSVYPLVLFIFLTPDCISPSPTGPWHSQRDFRKWGYDTA